VFRRAPGVSMQWGNMEPRRIFRLDAIGLTDSERRIIKSICAITSGRVRAYQLLDHGAPGAHIFLVDIDDSAAFATWQKRNPGETVPSIFVIARGAESVGKYSVRRPLVPTALMKLLDEITVAEHAYLPEVKSIGAGVSGDSEILHVAISVAEPQHPGQQFRALVVDDSVTVRKQLELSLKLLGGRAHCVETGEEALASLEIDDFDMVFLDVVLPGADGYQVCRTIKRHRRHKSTPVIMLTSKGTPFDKVRGSLAGCDNYLTKPVKEATFREIVSKHLPNRLAGGRNTALA